MADGNLKEQVVQLARREAEAILRCVHPEGAILVAPASQGGERVVPYFANLAAIGLVVAYTLTRNRRYLSAAEGWLRWYTRHLNHDGTIDDYRLQGNRLEPVGDCDSTDSYAATYLEALQRYQQAQPAPHRLASLEPTLEAVSGAIRLTLQPDGLTWAKPSYRVKLLMDNVEVYRGWRAAALLAQQRGRVSEVQALQRSAERTLNAIEERLFLQERGYYAWAMHENGIRESELNSWYPSVMAQLMAVAWLPPNERRKRLFGWLRQQWSHSWQQAVEQADLAVLVWWGMAAVGAGDFSFALQMCRPLMQASTLASPSPAERAHAIRLGAALLHRNPQAL